MSFGLTFDKLLIIAIIAVFLIGPDRLPGYAAQLARLVKSLRSMADGAKERMREEMGPEFDEVAPATPKPVAAQPYIESAYDQRQRKRGKARPAPFDAEAT